MDWLDFANQTAQDLIGLRAAELAAPSDQVSTTANGVTYKEGQPAGGISHSIAGIPTVYLLGGAFALLLGYLVLKK